MYQNDTSRRETGQPDVAARRLAGGRAAQHHMRVGWVGSVTARTLVRLCPPRGRGVDELSKRRADGPAVTRKPKRPAQKKPMKRRVLDGPQVAADRRPGRHADRRRRRSTTPTPRPTSPTPTPTSRPRRRSSTTPTARPSSARSPPRTASRSRYGEMPDNIKQAVVAAEDRASGPTSGIDPKGIIRAAFSNARGNSTQGASTITQQYVKILYLTQEQSLKRKAKEAFLSLKIQREQSKQEILEGYLNTIYFGRGAYGIQAAAMAYFDVPAKDLNLKQAAVLASVLNDPNDLDPDEGKEAKAELQGALRLRARRDGRHRRHHRRGGRPGQPGAAEVPQDRGRQPVRRPEGPHAAPGPQRAASRWATPTTEIDGGGLRVTTTFTPEAMAAAEEGVLVPEARGLRRQGAAHRGGDRRARHRRPARLLRRPGLPRLRDQLGRGRRHGRARRSSRSRWPPRSRRASPSRTPSRATRPTSSPTASRSATRAAATATTTARTSTRVTALEESINTAFVDMSASIPDGPEKIQADGQRAGHPAGQGRPRSTPASRRSAATSAPTTR